MHNELTDVVNKLEAINSNLGSKEANIEEKESTRIKFDNQSRSFDSELWRDCAKLIAPGGIWMMSFNGMLLRLLVL